MPTRSAGTPTGIFLLASMTSMSTMIGIRGPRRVRREDLLAPYDGRPLGQAGAASPRHSAPLPSTLASPTDQQDNTCGNIPWHQRHCKAEHQHSRKGSSAEDDSRKRQSPCEITVPRRTIMSSRHTQATTTCMQTMPGTTMDENAVRSPRGGVPASTRSADSNGTVRVCTNNGPAMTSAITAAMP